MARFQPGPGSQSDAARSCRGRGWIRVLPVAALAAVCLTGCGSDEQSITLLVRDAEANTMISGVEVRLAGQEAPLAVTDARGLATVQVPTTGGEMVRLRLSRPAARGGPRYAFEDVYEFPASELTQGLKTIWVRQAQGDGAVQDTLVSLQVASTPPGAKVIVDGARRGRTPLVIDSLAAGRHVVRLEQEGFAVWEQEYAFEPGSQQLSITLTARERAKASLAVFSTPEGANVAIDGTPTGRTTPAQFEDLDPGTHRIRLTKPGYHAFETEVDLKAGGPVGSAGSVLEPIAQARPAEDQPTPSTSSPGFTKTYRVSVAPGWAEVYVDGGVQNWNQMGTFRIQLAEGPHDFHVKNDAAGVNATFRYVVRRGDPNNRLVLNYETGVVEARR